MAVDRSEVEEIKQEGRKIALASALGVVTWFNYDLEELEEIAALAGIEVGD